MYSSSTIRKAKSSVRLSSKIGIDSFGFSFEASAFQSVSKNSTRITHPRKIQPPPKGTRGSRANERCFAIVSLFPFFFFFPLFPCSFNIRNSREYPRKARVRFVSLPGKLHFEKSIFDPSLFLTRDELHTTNIYALTRGYVHRLAMNYLCPIVYDLFHDKGRIAVMEGIVMMVNFVTCALAWMYPVFGFISSIPSRRKLVSEDKKIEGINPVAREFVKCF